MIVNEVGFVPLSRTGAELFFFFIRDDVDDIGGVLGTLPCLHLFFCQFCLR